MYFKEGKKYIFQPLKESKNTVVGKTTSAGLLTVTWTFVNFLLCSNEQKVKVTVKRILGLFS